MSQRGLAVRQEDHMCLSVDLRSDRKTSHVSQRGLAVRQGD